MWCRKGESMVNTWDAERVRFRVSSYNNQRAILSINKYNSFKIINKCFKLLKIRYFKVLKGQIRYIEIRLGKYDILMFNKGIHEIISKVNKQPVITTVWLHLTFFFFWTADIIKA